MPYSFTWSAKDRSGQSVIREIEADTSEQAKTILLAQGFTDLELKEDEVAAVARAGFPKDNTFLGEPIKITAEDRQKARQNPTVTHWDVLRKGIGQSWTLLLLIVAMSGYEYYRGHNVSAILWAGGLVLWLGFLVCMGLPSVYYKKLIEASDWERWNEVLSLVNALKMIGRISIVKVPDSELTRYRAKAYVGLGDLQKGLAEYQQCEGRPDCPSWLYKLFVAGLYTVAKQYDTAIEYNRKAIEEKPSSTSWWDLAYRYARYKRDPAKARQAVAEAEKTPVADVAKPFCMRCRGVIAYLESDFTKARTELESAIHATENVKWRPFNDGHLAISRAYLSCVLANQREMEAAKRNLNLAKKYLVATKEDELLGECRHLIGEH